MRSVAPLLVHVCTSEGCFPRASRAVRGGSLRALSWRSPSLLTLSPSQVLVSPSRVLVLSVTGRGEVVARHVVVSRWCLLCKQARFEVQTARLVMEHSLTFHPLSVHKVLPVTVVFTAEDCGPHGRVCPVHAGAVRGADGAPRHGALPHLSPSQCSQGASRDGCIHS